MTQIGHNSGDDVLNATAQGQLKSVVQRWENLLAERAEVGENIKELRAEAKGSGFDPTTILAIIRIRAKDRAKLQEQRAILELYASAIDPALLDLI